VPFTDSDGAKIWWEELGDGEPLLLIHGLGSSLEMWCGIDEQLGTHHRVVRFDNRGIGRSDIPDGGYTLAQMARDAVAVLNAAGMETAHVFGVSLGSMIAQHVALDHPAVLRSLALGCTICAGPDMVRRAAVVEDLLQNRERMTPEQNVRAMLPYTIDPKTPPDVTENYVQTLLANRATAAGYFGQLMATARLSTWRRLGEVTTPTLVIGAEHDELIPPGNSADVARRIPGARYELLRDASHNFWVDQPQRTVELLLDWFAAH